jgi:predicted N-acetyltransferase YhbS
MPEGLEIRVAERGDLDALVAAMGQREFFTDRIGRTRQGVGELLVASLSGEVVGDVYLHREVQEEPELRREFPGVPVLNHLEVTPRLRRRGIGTALIRACEDAASRRHHDVLVLGVGLDNPGAKRLYERLGYLDWGKGPIVTRWTEPDGAGGIRRVSLDMDLMVRSFAAPPVDAWAPWQPREIARRLVGIERPWYVAGGWALELWRAELDLESLREHGDLEIAIPRSAYPTFAGALTGLDLYAVHAGAIWPLRGAKPKQHVRQVWVGDGDKYRMDLFLETGGDRTWIFKRDNRIRRSLRRVVDRTRDGVPYLRPEAVLLYKAADPRAKDEADFAAVAPDLGEDGRRWLAGALTIAYPGHRWIRTLDAVRNR